MDSFDNSNIFFIDLFCGAGGTSSGAHLAGVNVAACVNHDKKAIESHAINHPGTIHFTEDIRDFKVVEKLRNIVCEIRKNNPAAMIVLWASLECTNFSNAKGGLPRDADSRSLAEHMFMYLEELKPDVFLVENVREFLAWGPLDEDGKPVSRTKGADFMRWYKKVQSHGFEAEYEILNSADYGAYQRRTRLFIQFSKLGIKWPLPTHTENPKKDLFSNGLEKWKPVREVLDLNDKGNSIFDRPKPLVEATLARIYAGLIKFVAGGEEQFLIKNFSGKPNDKVHSFNKPCGTITTRDNKSLCFVHSYYGKGGVHDIEKPCPTITTKDRFAGVFLDQQYGNGIPRSIERPCGALTVVPKTKVIHTEFIINPQYKSAGTSVNKPCCTLIARMDKAPLSLACVELGAKVKVFETDSPMTIKIKEFMFEYGLSDIKMRMLRIMELLQIQGFPKNYKLVGTQTDQKKFIGNAVEVNNARALIEAVCFGLVEENHTMMMVA